MDPEHLAYMAGTAHLYTERCAVVVHHRIFGDLVPCVAVALAALHKTQLAGDLRDGIELVAQKSLPAWYVVIDCASRDQVLNLDVEVVLVVAEEDSGTSCDT